MCTAQYETPRYKVADNPHKTAIILRCFDLRFPAANKGFIQEELDLSGRSYYSMKRAGGAIALARPELKPDAFTSLVSEITLLLGHHPEITHFIALSHQDCLRYRELLGGGYQSHVESSDLVLAAEHFSEIFPQLQFGAYYAKFTNTDRTEISFDTVFETDSSTSLRKALCIS